MKGKISGIEVQSSCQNTLALHRLLPDSGHELGHAVEWPTRYEQMVFLFWKGSINNVVLSNYPGVSQACDDSARSPNRDCLPTEMTRILGDVPDVVQF